MSVLSIDQSRSYRPDPLNPRVMVAVSIALACGVGVTVATEKWLFLGTIFVVILVLVWPVEVVLGLYAFLIPFETITTLTDSSGSNTTLLWYLGLASICVLFVTGWLRGRFVTPPRAALYWSLFILLGALTCMWSIDQNMAVRRLPTTLSLWLLYIALASVRISKRELSWITFLTILGGFCASVYAAYIFFRAGGPVGRVAIGGGSQEADPNFFAATLLLPFSLAFAKVIDSSTWTRKLFALAATGMITLGLFLTMSRGALVAMSAMVLVFVFRLRLNWRLLIPITVLGAALMLMPNLFFERVQDVAQTRGAGRLDIWTAGIESLQSYGIFGAGLENFPNAYTEYAGRERFYQGGHRAPHNIYLCAAVEFGILGILLLLAAVVSQLRALKVWNTTLNVVQVVSFEAACYGILVAGFTLDVIWRKAFWLIWAMPAIAGHCLAENKQP